MTAPVRFKQSDLTRALKGAAKAGLQVARVELNPDGKIVIMTGEGAANGGANPWDKDLEE